VCGINADRAVSFAAQLLAAGNAPDKKSKEEEGKESQH
jgi:hypothetical protein